MYRLGGMNDIQFWERYLNHLVLLIVDDKRFTSKKEDILIGVDSTHVHLKNEGSIGRQYIIRVKSIREGSWSDNPEYRREAKDGKR